MDRNEYLIVDKYVFVKNYLISDSISSKLVKY
jgi:hypothetical protein